MPDSGGTRRPRAGAGTRRRPWFPRRSRTDRAEPGPAEVVGVTLSGGGASASFHLGALTYLYDVAGVTPSVFTGTSAGSIVAAVLAQADDHDGQRALLRELDRVYRNVQRPSDMLVELDWFTELQKLVPALQRVGQARASALQPQTITLPTLGLRRPGQPRPAISSGTLIRVPRWDPAPVRETLSTIWSVGRSRPDFDELLRGGRREQSMFRRGPVFDWALSPPVFDPARLAASRTELRIAVVGLESGQLRYVTGNGTVVDRGNRPVPGHEPVPVVEAVHASCAIPAVYPPVRLGQEHYVDGGTRENLPVEVAMSHLGVTRCYAINSLPQGLPTDSSYAHKDMLSIVLRAAAGIMAEEIQLDDVARAAAAGAVLIAPEVNVLGVLEVDPGLLDIAADYGYLRAAEACEQATQEEQGLTRQVVELRRRIWRREKELLSAEGTVAAEDLVGLGHLKRELRALVAQVRPRRLPARAPRWWQEWERHPFEVTQPPAWLDQPDLPAGGETGQHPGGPPPTP